MFQLQAPTYGLAEQAASIIRAQYNGLPPPSASATLTMSGTALPSTSANGNKNGAPQRASQTFSAVLAGVLAAALVMRRF